MICMICINIARNGFTEWELYADIMFLYVSTETNTRRFKLSGNAYKSYVKTVMMNFQIYIVSNTMLIQCIL